MALTDQQDYVYWIERDSIAIAKYDSSQNVDNQFTGPEGDKDIHMYVSEYADDFTEDLTEESIIPSEFHEALVFRAVQRGYEVKMSQNPEMVKNASYFQGGFDKVVKEGQKYANIGRTGGSYHISGSDY